MMVGIRLLTARRKTSVVAGILLLLAWVMYSPVPLHAETAAIAQGFQTIETNLAAGALMSFKPDSPNMVELANTDRVNQLVGIVGEKPLVELTTNTKEVRVITSGVAPALVSNINGDIKTGDKITASPIDGVGMKATSNSQIIGTAQASLDTSRAVSQAITDKNGKTQSVKIGQVAMQVNVTYYSSDTAQTFVPAFLQALANSVAGREVSAVRVLIAALVLLLGFVSIAVLLYSSVRSSIISIGRNPLSEAAVHKSLIEVGLITIGILLVMVIAVYLVLRT